MSRTIVLVTVLLGLAPVAATAQEEPPRAYGDRGTSHAGLVLGLGSGTGGFRYAAGVDYGYFVLDRIAPGVQAQVSGGSNVLTSGITMGTLRLVPIRTDSFSLFVVGRAGRVFLSDHRDGWGAGVGGGVIVFSSGRIGIQISYDVLRMFPESFCADLASACTVQGLALGLVAGF